MDSRIPFRFEGTVPVRVKEEKSGLDMSCELRFWAVCALQPAPNGEEMPGEDVIKSRGQLAVTAAYARVYPEGMCPEEINAAPAEAVRKAAQEDFEKALSVYGAAPEDFRIEKHSLGDKDAALLEKFLRAAEFLSPDTAAAAMKAEAMAKIAALQTEKAVPAEASPAKPAEQTDAEPLRWVCACGSVNTMSFCPECGKKKSYQKWICACGSVNRSPFCPECGRKFI